MCVRDALKFLGDCSLSVAAVSSREQRDVSVSGFFPKRFRLLDVSVIQLAAGRVPPRSHSPALWIFWYQLQH